MGDIQSSERLKLSGGSLEETYIRHLEQRLRHLEIEKRGVEQEKTRIQREVYALRKELERLRAPPLVTGVVVDVLSDERVIVRSSSGPHFIVRASRNVDIKELVPGTQVAMNQRSYAILEVLPPSKDPAVLGMEIIEKPDVTYGDIGGLADKITEIREMVELPLKRPELFEEVGIDPPKGVLLYGPPGTGKTLIAKAVANETNSTFIRIIASELVRKYIGEGARLVREIFKLAKEKAPSIIFIDELDAIGGRRLEDATSGDREVQRTLMQLLSEMDGFKPRGDVKVIGATNRPDILDEALLRPGRFDRLIEIPIPDQQARVEILRIHTRKMKLAKDVDLQKIARETQGASGADIKCICTEAGMFAIRSNRTEVTERDFIEAIYKVMGQEEIRPSTSPTTSPMYG